MGARGLKMSNRYRIGYCELAEIRETTGSSASSASWSSIRVCCDTPERYCVTEQKRCSLAPQTRSIFHPSDLHLWGRRFLGECGGLASSPWVTGNRAKSWPTFTQAVSARGSSLRRRNSPASAPAPACSLISPSAQRRIDFRCAAQTYSTSVSPLTALPPVAFRRRQRMIE